MKLHVTVLFGSCLLAASLIASPIDNDHRLSIECLAENKPH